MPLHAEWHEAATLVRRRLAATRPARAVRQARELAEVSRAAARLHGVRPLRAARTARRLRTRQGFTYREALRVGALDPAMTDAERAAMVSEHATFLAEARLNNDNVLPALVRDKSAFYRYAQAVGLPVPALYGVLEARASGWGATGRIVHDDADLVAFLREDVPERFVVKPAEGYQGVGVRLLTRRPDGLLAQHPDGLLRVEELVAALRGDREFGTWVVQERLVNHPDMGRLSDPSGLDTVRVGTMVRRDGDVEVLFATLKLALAGGASDNFLGGTTGNGAASADPATGVLGGVVLPAPGGAGFEERDDNPVTGARVRGETLPLWDEVRALVLTAAPHLLPSRAIGWDVALTPRGPVLLEANIHWLLFPPVPGRWREYDRLCAEGGHRPY